MKQGLLFLAIIFFWFLPPAQAEIKTFVHTVKQPFSGSQSPDDARTAAVHKAKQEVLEEAGSYLETLTIVENGRLTKDQVLALAGGILNTEVISQKPYTTGEGYGVTVKVRVRVDSSVLEDRVKELISDKTSMSELVTIRKREKDLLDKIERLEEVNLKLAKKQETETVKKEKMALERDFQQTTKGLDASALIVQVMELKKDNEFTNPRKALELLDKIIGLDPDFALAYNNRGFIYDDFKQYYRAIRDYDKAIELDPGFALAYNNRGLSYYRLKQYARAIQDYDKAIALDQDFEMVYNNRGLAYDDLKQYDRAMQDYNKAIALDSSLAKVYSNRGRRYTEIKQYYRAIRDLDKAIELNPDFAMAYYNRALPYIYLKQYNRAIQDLDRSILLDPGYAPAYNNRGLLYITINSLYQGCVDMNKACELGECKGLGDVKSKGYCN
jgi:tetratricopeptide (TPR) repeat protein